MSSNTFKSGPAYYRPRGVRPLGKSLFRPPRPLKVRLCRLHFTTLLLFDKLRIRALLAALLIEVLELREVAPALDERLHRRRVLPSAVPAARRVALAILRVGVPLLA